jgi:hypothetical protein
MAKIVSQQAYSENKQTEIIMEEAPEIVPDSLL